MAKNISKPQRGNRPGGRGGKRPQSEGQNNNKSQDRQSNQ